MRIWNAKKLAVDLASGHVSERQQLSYLLAMMCASFLIADRYVIHILSDSIPNTLDLILSVTGFIITICGTIYCYSAIKKGHKHPGLITRFICLSIPAFVRLTAFLFVLVLPLVIASFFDNFVDSWLNSESTTWFDVGLTSASGIAFFVYLRFLIRASYADA